MFNNKENSSCKAFSRNVHEKDISVIMIDNPKGMERNKVT